MIINSLIYIYIYIYRLALEVFRERLTSNIKTLSMNMYIHVWACIINNKNLRQESCESRKHTWCALISKSCASSWASTCLWRHFALDTTCVKFLNRLCQWTFWAWGKKIKTVISFHSQKNKIKCLKGKLIIKLRGATWVVLIIPQKNINDSQFTVLIVTLHHQDHWEVTRGKLLWLVMPRLNQLLWLRISLAR